MKIAIFGSKQGATKLHKLLQIYRPDIEVVNFIENLDFATIGETIENIHIISLYKALHLHKHGDFESIIIPGIYHKIISDEMVKLLISHDFHQDNIYIAPINIFRKSTLDDSDAKRIMTKYEDSVQLFDLIAHVNDHCNLNCKSCCVFSNLVKEPSFYDINNFSRDLEKLRTLVEDIYHISILGGEPLLNENIESYIHLSRKNYPYTQITLTTNGVLLKKIDKSLIECLKSNNVDIKISLYPPFSNQIDKMVEFLKSNNISFFVEPVYVFNKRFSLQPIMDKQQSSDKCRYYCLGLRDGKIARCELALNIHHLNKYYNINLPENSGINIHNESLTSTLLISKLKEPLDLCAYCTEGLICETNEWKQSEINPNINDFINKYAKYFNLMSELN